MSNIIPFPVKKKEDQEEVVFVVDSNKIDDAEEDWDFIMNSLSGNIPKKYFENENCEDFLDDMIFIGEALKSALYRHHSLKHPIQKLVDENIVYDEEGEMTFLFEESR